MPPRRLLLPLAGTFAAVLLAIAVHGSRTTSAETNSLGVPPINGIASLEPGDEICQEPVGIDTAFSRVALAVSTAPADSRATLLRARILDLPIRRVLATGTRRLTVMEARSSQTPIDLRPAVRPDRLVAVCFENRGPGKLGVLGDFYGSGLAAGAGAHPSQTTSTALLNGLDTGKDAGIFFPADPQPSRLSQVPKMLARAGRFRPDIVGSWTYWLLLGTALLVAPLILARALAAANEPAADDP